MNKAVFLFSLIFFGTPLLGAFLRADSLADAAPDAGMSELMTTLVDLARQSKTPIFSVTEIDHGKITTVSITPSTRCHNCYSVAKLFTVTAIGILEDRGLLNTDDFVYPIFKDQFPEGYDPKWEKVRIKDVLRQRVGFGKGGLLDIDAQDSRTWESDDFLKILLSQPLEYEPGSTYVYTDAAFYLASRIVAAKSGERLDDFLIREVFQPLGFMEYAFSKCPQGHPMGATGLYISTEDMAKLGQLYCQKGVYNGKRILSEKFVEKVVAETFEAYPFGNTGEAFVKGGMYQQFLYFNFRTQRAIAIHSFNGEINKMQDTIAIMEKCDR